VLRSSPT